MSNKLIILALVYLTGITALFVISRYVGSIVVLADWIILGLFIFSVSLFKLSSRFIFLFAFGLFILSGILMTLMFAEIAEVVMRFSLMGWLVGMGKYIIKYFFSETTT